LQLAQFSGSLLFCDSASVVLLFSMLIRWTQGGVCFEETVSGAEFESALLREKSTATHEHAAVARMAPLDPHPVFELAGITRELDPHIARTD